MLRRITKLPRKIGTSRRFRLYFGAMMAEPRIHVLIINWNGREHLDACYRSLLAQDYDNARFVLVDNASADDSVALVRDSFGHDPRVGVLECERNLGWSGGNNRGMEAAIADGADYVFLLNNDTAVEPDCLRRLVEMAEARPQTGALAPKMLMFKERQIINSIGLECSIVGACWDRGLGRVDDERWNATMPVIGVSGGAAFFRTAALEKAGLLPEDYEIYLDDLELCLRVWNAGYTVQTCPEAVVYHKFSATMGEGEKLRRKYYLNVRNRWRLMLRNFPISRALPVAVMTAVGEARAVGRALLDGEAWKAGVHARAWLDALRYLPTVWAERRERKRRGIRKCRFWRHIRWRPMFFAGAELPEDGWYQPRIIAGEEFRPIARYATATLEPGRYRIIHGNPYAALGPARVTVRCGGKAVAKLATKSRGMADVHVDGAPLSFESGRVFWAEHTGERIDIGGWLRVEPAE